jgi:hypothetical protein
LQVFALKIVRALELLTMLNHGHRHRGFVYQHARFGPDKKSLEVDVRPREGSAAVCSGCHQPLLKKSRWCVLKRKENLTSQQKLRLPDLLRYNLRTVRADLRKEDFQQFWEYNSPTWAGMFLDFRCQQTMRSRSEPMKKIARTLRAHRALLLNYGKARKQFSSGVVEGLNNKAKVTMRRSYGFRTFHILELALYHSLGKLPEPELTHEFF